MKAIVVALVGLALASAARAQAIVEPARPVWALGPGQERVDVATLAPGQLIGARVETMGGRKIGDVTDVILSEDGRIETIAVAFGGILGFGSDEIPLTLEDVDFVKIGADMVIVRTDLTPEALETRTGDDNAS